jgi:LemA protein
MSLALIIILVIVIIIAFFVWGTYNSLVTLRVRVSEAWSDITVQLKRRAGLIPNLVSSVKGYAAHETEVFEGVTQARAAVLGAKTVKETAAAESQFEGALGRIFAVAEAYPQLRATENFQQLQTELVDTEDRIQAARRFYNTGVRDFNTKQTLFPSNIIAKLFKFTPRDFFEVDDPASVQEPVEVTF